MFQKSLLIILAVFMTASFAQAEIYFINDSLSIDTNKASTRVAEGDDCGPNYPEDEICMLSCYEGRNLGASVYTCSVGMTALYYEEIIIPGEGTETISANLFSSVAPATDTTYSTGNTLQTWDERSVIFYPYQRVRLCFNLGRPLTTQDTNWVLAEGYPTAEIDPAGCMEEDAPDEGTPTDPPVGLPCDEAPEQPHCDPIPTPTLL